jgi:release factor glutamine methyltransferase
VTSLSDSMARAIERLGTAGIDNAPLDARLLIGYALEFDRAQLLSQSQRALTADESSRIEALIARRAAREPVARILGEREFWGLPFGLNEATLEPRPDSETLVEAALKNLRGKSYESACGKGGAVPLPLAGGARGGRGVCFTSRIATLLLINPFRILKPRSHDASPPPAPPASGRGALTASLIQTAPRILDLGAGTGCLLLALLRELPDATGLGIDSAPRAVEQAQKNAERLGLASRAAFKAGNWLDGVHEPFDAIISNPPYIPSGDIAALMPEVRAHDPLPALDGGKDGLDIYRALIPRLPQFLKPEGFAIFETGQGQADAVAALCRDAGLKGVKKYRDLGGVERCVAASVL